MLNANDYDDEYDNPGYITLKSGEKKLIQIAKND